MQKIISVIYLFCLLSIPSFLNAQVTFTAVDEAYDCDMSSFCVDIAVSNFDSVTSFQHVYEWDTSIMQLTAFNDFIDVVATSGGFAVAPSMDSTDAGRAPYSWLSLAATSGQTLTDGTVIAELCFDVNNAIPGVISFTGSNTTLQTVSGFVNGTNSGDIPATYNNGTASPLDSTNPSISCPSDVTVESFGTQVNGIAPTSFSDNCGIDSVSYEMVMGAIVIGSGLDDASGESFTTGETTVTYTITDGGGNTDNCSFTVTLTSPPANAGSLQFIPEINLDCDANTITVELLVVNFDSISGFQMGIQWDQAVLDYMGATSSLPALTTISPNPSGDAILFAFAPLSPANIPYTLPDSTSILSMSFDLIGTLQSPLLDFISFPGIQIGVGQVQNGVDINLVQDTDFFFMDEILNVIDNSAPTISGCPTNISQDTDTGSCDAVVTWTEPTATDNCGLNSFASNVAPGSAFSTGTTTVTYTASDLAGNTSTCSFDVTVTDNEDPVITCPADVTFDNDTGICTSSMSPGTASATDACGVAMVTSNAPASLALGISTITYTATDVNGNTSECTQSVTVQDVEDPTVICPPAVNSCPGQAIVLGSPTTGDNCGVASVDNDAPATFPAGTTTVTYTVTDNSGNMASCTQTVTIADTEDPMITCPANISECPGTTVTLGTPTTSDNCGVASVTNDAPATIPDGTTIITYTVTDVGGNTASCMQTVALIDIEDPTITCPADVSDCPGATVTLGTPTTSDNCGVASVTNDAPANFPLGATTVTHTVTDVGGNSATCTQQVTIADTEMPMVTCPSTDAIEVDPGTCAAVYVNSLLPTTSDNCDTDLTVTYAISAPTTASGNDDATGVTFAAGNSTLTYTVIDDAGNINTCSVVVQVNDNENPVVTCPSDVLISTNQAIADTVVNNINATVSDNCGVASLTFAYTGELTGTGIGTDASGTSFPPGTTTVTYTVTDLSSNSLSCSFEVEVVAQVLDLIECPADVQEDNNADQCAAIVDDIEPTVFIPASSVASITYSLTGATTGSGNNDASGASFNVGTTNVQYVITDINGNMDSCMFMVTINDVDDPEWTNCPLGITASITNTTDCTSTATWNIPTPTDNCAVVNILTSHDPGDSFPLGTTVVTYSASDAAGNSATCTFDVTVVDDTPPTPVNCPMDIISPASSSDCQSTVVWTAPTFDDCPPVSVTSTHDPGDVFPLGTTTVIYIAVDASGNDTTCTFNILVQDTEAPVPTCPADLTVNSLGTDCGAFVNWPAPSAVDNCDNNVDISVTPSAGTFFNAGTTTVTATATDDAGNSADCTFDVTVTDAIAPTFDCPSGTIQLGVEGNIISDPAGLINSTMANADCDMLTINYSTPAASDNCGIQSTTLNSGIASGSEFPIGTTTLDFITFDNSGNFGTCVFDIEVIGLTAISASITPSSPVCAGENIQLSTDSDIAGSTFSWTGPNTFSSADPMPTINGVTEAAEGTYNVTVTYPSGCSVTASVDLVVEEGAAVNATSNAPICTGEDLELNVELPGGANIMSIQWSGPNSFSSDLESPVITNPGTINEGIYSVLVTYVGGCTAEASINVSISNLPTPEIDIDCAADICLGSGCRLTGTEYAPSPDFYNWSASPSEGAGLPFDTENNQITINPTQPGIYIYTYSVELNGCVSEEATIAITVEGPPEAVDDSYEVTFGQSGILPITSNDVFNGNIGVTPTIINGPSNGTLEFDADNLTYTYTPNEGFAGEDQFFYEICYDCGEILCDNATVDINVEFDGDCEIPTLITPNGDNTNDFLVIQCIQTEDFPNNEIIIYNQWGDEVFTAAPYQNNWNGTRDGEDLPDGTYYIVFKLGNNADPIRQYITIFR